jgi:hypothetical protein
MIDNKDLKTTWDALGLYQILHDGLVWNPDNRTVGFSSQESAKQFKNSYPDWLVWYKQ